MHSGLRSRSEFRQSMAREDDMLLYDHEVNQRVGGMIGKAVHGCAIGYLRE